MTLGFIEWVLFLGMVGLIWMMLDIFGNDHYADDTRQGSALPDHQHGRYHVLFPLPGSQEQHVMVFLPAALIERLRNAAYWTGNRPVVDLVAEAIEDSVTQMEEVNGADFHQPVSPLKRETTTR